LSRTLSRRRFLRRALGAAIAFGGSYAASEAARKGWDLYEQHRTWEEASRPNAEFFARHAGELSRLSLGGSFAPEQWPLDAAGQADALASLGLAVRELALRRLRLGLRWSRSVDAAGATDLSAYRSVLDYCFAAGVEVCLAVGPIRVFRWPEEHLPAAVLESLDLPEKGAAIEPGDALAAAALDHLDGLLEGLRREYGASLAGVRGVQIENEPYFPLGAHRWRLSDAYLAETARRVGAALPHVDILVTSAGRLNLNSVRGLFARLLREDRGFAGRLVSGFDFHYVTPLRDSFPIIRHFDQVSYASPFAPTTEEHIRDGRELGFRIEVTEGQAEPYGKFLSPGNSARDLRFLILRCLDKVLDRQAPALIRLWGVEELTKRMIGGSLTDEHRRMIEILQAVNARAAGGQETARR
jgi:hypothetical protein